MLVELMSSPSKRSLYQLANALLHSNNTTVACFTSTSKKVQDGINTSGNPREGGWRVADTSAGMPGVDYKTKLGREEENSDTAEVAKAGAAAAIDTGLKIGEMTKQTVDGVWDAAKKTAESVRDSVERPNDEEKEAGHVADKHVEDLRRRAGGYDLRNR